MFYDDHDPPHIHVEYQSKKALMDFQGNILKGDLHSQTAVKRVREWIDFRYAELLEYRELARQPLPQASTLFDEMRQSVSDSGTEGESP